MRQSSEHRSFDPLASTASIGPEPAREASVEQLTAATLEAMSLAWHQGSHQPAEAWLSRHPELAAQSEAAVRIIFEEICLREEGGQRVETTEIYARFPQWRGALEVMLDCRRLLDTHPAEVEFPRAGQQLGELRLLRELGRGGQGRVFLATQPSLSDRPLVVKFTGRAGDEHLSLARLQHTHIVPLYLVQDFPAQNLRALCMPYLGGASWSSLLDALSPIPWDERQGRHIVERLEAQLNDFPSGAQPGGPALGFLARASFVDAVCWIGACLADALHYAHQRGLVHLDVKPSNVLLAADGQPMLLDFHLAREVAPAGSESIDRLGGTRGYMSHEQLLCAAAVREGRAIPLALDGRSDIYSLGVLLHESLGGAIPEEGEPLEDSDLSAANPAVSRGLQDIIRKCLAPNPQDRYTDAGQLAADLRRQLASLPLRGVANRSLTERWRKWRRRKPHALPLASAALIGLTVVGATAAFYHAERVRAARSALAETERHLAEGEFAAAIDRATAGRAAIAWLPWQADLDQTLKSRLTQARRSQLAAALHTLVERLRFVDSSARYPTAKLRELDRGCERIWQVRDQIVEASDTAAQRRLRTDLLDLAILWSRLRVRLAGEGQLGQERHWALGIMDDVEALCGPSPVIELVRRQYGDQAPPRAIAVGSSSSAGASAWEHDAIGRFYFQADELSDAQREFQAAIALEPDAFWPNFYLTLCDYRLGDFARALTSASVCVALAPKSSECLYNRALCQQALEHFDEARQDFTRAIALDPTSADAVLHRGMLLAEMGDHAAALVDMQAALKLHANPAETYYQMALVYQAAGDRKKALDCVDEAMRQDPEVMNARDLKRRLEAAP